MKDCHVHTNISHDGISSIKDYLDIAQSKNVDEITFTEHYDIYDGLKTNLKALDVNQYEKEYYQCKDDDQLKTNFGIEIGLQPDTYTQINNMVKSHHFDFIIGSSHITCKKDIAMDKSFFDGITRREAYLKYFREVLQNIKLYNDEFDVYGHIDYIVRYGGYAEKKIDYTSGIRYGLGMPHPNKEIIKRYKQLGGKIITMGSDAHKINDLGADFDVASSILMDAGFQEIAVFHNRTPDFVKIKELVK